MRLTQGEMGAALSSGLLDDPDRAVVVRAASPVDERSLALLLQEMQRHYGAPVPPSRAVEMARLLCSLPPEGFNPRTLLAFVDGDAVGSCVLNVMLPAAELCHSLYIRDLYVAARARRRGVGRALVRRAAEMVREGGFCALDWTADSGNHTALRLYGQSGAMVLGRTYYRLADDTLDALIAE